MIISRRVSPRAFRVRYTPIDASGSTTSNTIKSLYRFLKKKKKSRLEYNTSIKGQVLFEEVFKKAREKQEKAMAKLFGKRTLEKVKDIYIMNMPQSPLNMKNIKRIPFIEVPITITKEDGNFDYYDLMDLRHGSFSFIMDHMLQEMYTKVTEYSALEDMELRNKMIIKEYKKYSCARLFSKDQYSGDYCSCYLRIVHTPIEHRDGEENPLNNISNGVYSPNSRTFIEDSYSYAVLSLTPRTRVRSPNPLNEGRLSRFLQVKISLTDFENYFNMFGLLLSNVIEYYVTMKEIENMDIRTIGWTQIAKEILDIVPIMRSPKFNKIQNLIAQMNPIGISSLRSNVIDPMYY